MKKKHLQKKLKIFSQSLVTLLFSLMPFKVKAVDLSVDVDFLGSISQTTTFVNPIGECNIIQSGGYVTVSYGGNTCSPSLLIQPGQTGFNTDYIIGININAYNLVNNNIIYSYQNGIPSLKYLYNTNLQADASYVGMTTRNISTSSTVLTFYFKLNTSGSNLGAGGMLFTPYIGIKSNEFLTTANRIEVLALKHSSGNGAIDSQAIINAINQGSTTNQQWLQTINTNLQNLMQNMHNNQGTINNINNNIQNSIDKTEQASEEGQTNADTSQTDNETASQNIIGVVGNIVQVFYTPAGDCNIDVDLGNLDLGNLNFCSGKPREFEQIINLAGSILIVYACYRVARTIFRIWLTLSIFGQGGNTKGDK